MISAAEDFQPPPGWGPPPEGQPAAALPPVLEVAAPRTISETHRIGDRLCLAAEGNRSAQLMFIATSVFPEEAEDTVQTTLGTQLRSRARFMKGPVGMLFKDLLLTSGLDPETDIVYTALCRWLLPKQNRSKPKAAEIAWGVDMLFHEIAEVKPKLIVCMGKPVFDLLSDVKLSQSDIEGGFFQCEKFNCILYFMPDLFRLRVNPPMYERYRVDMQQIRRMNDDIKGVVTHRVPEYYRVVSNSHELRALVEEWRAGDFKLFSVDAEWGGSQVIDARIRSVQFCWAPGVAVYIRFMDDQGNYTFDVSYKEAGAIMSPWLDRPDVKYVGHHISIDLTVLAYWLGLQWYRKSLLDTEFAEQTADEYAPLGLDRLSMKYTTKGRYDIELLLWKKSHKMQADEGYGRIPDPILIPYACRDVDVVFQAVPFIIQRLIQQDLWNYYVNIFNPFVTDVFTNFSLVGLPMDIGKMDYLRDMYNFAKIAMEEEFRDMVVVEAENFVRDFLQMVFGADVGDIMMMQARREMEESPAAAFEFLKNILGTEHLAKFDPIFMHWQDAPMFNIRSSSHMRRWLFQVKGYTPVKSTNAKDKGLPSTSWERVLSYSPDKQAEFTPSTDKQSLQILSEQHGDKVLGRLLELNAVGNLCKAFLKEPTIDEETGLVTRENGLHFWLSSDGRVHGQMSTTETGRPRSWKPNSLNWPSFTNAAISAGIARCFNRFYDSGRLPAQFHNLIPAIKDFLADPPKRKDAGIPSIRSVVKPPEGWCLVESDYQTAEIRGLAFISGDAEMIRLVVEPDPCFCLHKDGKSVVRLSYPNNGSIHPANQKEEYLYAIYDKEAQTWTKVIDADLLRGKDGKLVLVKNDLHWSLAEMVHGKPREMLSDKKDRGAAKVGNFSSAYGATPTTLERKIEADTGAKPEPGTGQKILDALQIRQPVATEFLMKMEETPKYPGYYRAASGRLRRFVGHPDSIGGFSSREKESAYNSAGRECRNFPMQESVASTAARAGTALLELGRSNNLQGTQITILYDSVVTMCPLHERHIWRKAHDVYMFLANGWKYDDRLLRYPIDNEFNTAWSQRPDKATQKQLDAVDYMPTPEHLKPLEGWLDNMIQYYTDNPWASVQGIN